MDRVPGLLKRHEQQVRYLLVGGWNTLFGYGVYALLYWLLRRHMSYVLILVPANVIAITQNYFGYKFVVFRTHGNYLREYFKTYLVYGAAFVVNLGLLPLLHEVAGLPVLVAQAVAMAVTVVLSYFFYKYFAFRPADGAGERWSPAGERWSRLDIGLGAVAVFVFLAALAFTYSRLYRGIDLLDESFYIAVPYRFALGARPFVDEVNLLQLAGLVVYPFVKAFVAISGGATGLMLYTRHLYLLFALGVATSVFCLLRTLMRWQYAALAATLYVSYFAFDLPQLNYNTLASGFLTLGVVLGLWTILHGRSHWYMVAAGVCHGVAVFVFPTLIVIVPLYAIAAALVSAGRRRAAWAYVAGAGAAGAAGAIVLVSFGVGNVLRSVRFQLADAKRVGQGGGFAKVGNVISGWERLMMSRAHLLVIAAVLYLIYRRYPRARLLLLAYVPPSLFMGGLRWLLEAAGFAIAFMFVSFFLLLFTDARDRSLVVKLAAWGLVPALAAGIMTGYTSASSFVNSEVGFLPAMLCCAALLVLVAAPRPGEPQDRLARALPWLTAAALTLTVAATIVYQFAYIPRMVPYRTLTVQMRAGPYAGIYTTVPRAAFLTKFSADLATLVRPDERIIVFNGLPAAYLMWPHAAAANTVWITTSGGAPGVLPPATWDYFKQAGVVPDVVIRIANPAEATPWAVAHQLNGGLPYPLVLTRTDVLPNYIVYRRPAWFSIDTLPAQPTLPQSPAATP
jgi:putative flippase GtrA